MSLVELKALIVATSAYYGQKLDPTVIAMYAEDLVDLPIEQVRDALLQIRRDPKITRFPLPAVIRDRIQPADTVEADARDAASRIVAAISRFGWPNGERARGYVGELGWLVVERQGGWQNLCQAVETDDIGILQAQWRELAVSLIKRAKAGTLNLPPSLPAGSLQVTPTMTLIPKAQESQSLERLYAQLDHLKKEKEENDGGP